MKTHLITITYHDCALRYGFSETDLHGFADLGLLALDPVAGTIQEEPDHLARLARLHHELGLTKEGIDVVLAMRQRLLTLQHELMLQRARARQFEHLLGSTGPTLDAEEWL